MQRFKRFSLLAIFLIVLTQISACSKSEPISPERFVEVAHELGLVTKDITAEAKLENPQIESCISATKDNDSVSILFMTFQSARAAGLLFGGLEGPVRNMTGSVSVESSVSIGKYESYKRSIRESYYTVVRVNDTLLYTENAVEYKEDIDALIKAMGY